MLLFLNADGGGERKTKFERVQVCMLCLVMKLNIGKLAWVNTAASSSAWNPVERKIAAMSRAFTNASMCRAKTNTNLEQEFTHKKS